MKAGPAIMALARQQELQVQGRDIPTLFAAWADRCPDKPFLIWAPFDGGPIVWSYAAFWDASARVAAGLAARGIGKGARLILHMENCPEFLLTWLACARLGVVVVTTNTRSSADELGYFVEKAQASVVVTQREFAHHFAAGAIDGGADLIVSDPSGVADGFTALLAAEGRFEAYQPDLYDDCSIQFTSGTTSRPKGVVWSYANLAWAARANARNLDIRHEDVCHIVLPLFHTNAQSYSLTGAIWAGATILLQPRFSASRFWAAAVEHGASWASLIPFCVKALLGQGVPKGHRFRLWIPAVALPGLVDGPHGIRTFGLWGMTETITQGIVGDLANPGRDMCIGRAAPDYAIEIRDEAGHACGCGTSGRLFVRGVPGISLFQSYLDDPEATARAVDHAGWLDTGDRVRIADNGDLFFMDRDKDMLKVGGENVAASEVEAVIMGSGLVEEVAVVGQKHAMLDEVPVAFVIARRPAPADLEARLIATCREKLADYKAVRAVHVVESLPRAALEKIAKNELRARLPELPLETGSRD